ncbi:putative ATP-dependent dna helicase pif1 [Rhypophila decipiens]|uniref:ATP-dependent DNA helicase n=1 Tax=Rhypophila decipiens TaxID=261697 RepID=A0AAN7B2N9_9PEZI|nr:putative ATP-dependent dna helicase pif1 [Rhypophila decipiens]
MEQLHELDYIPLSSPVSESEDGPSFAPADAAEAGVAPQTISNPSAGARRDPQLRLSEEQQKVVDLAAKGHNIFYTGSAGCGKSTVLHAIKRQLRDMGKHVKVMAPTGIAALAIGGETWWRFAGLGPDRLKMSIQKHFSSMASTTQKKLRKRTEKVDVIIIDEVSMVESNNFDRLNRLVKLARRDPNRAFGGLQVIVTGDFCQLPPVKPFEFCLDCGNKMQQGHNGEETTYYCANIKDCPRLRDPFHKWAFCSEAWKECNFEHIHLNGIHRQHDPELISMLQKCRIGEALSEGETDRLMVHESVSTNAITLFSTRKEVDNKNDQCFRALKTDPHEYKSFDDFWWNDDRSCQKDGDKNPVDSDGWESLNALNEHRYPETLTLKIGMPVVLLANLDVAAGLCNGSQGMICGFEPYDPAKLPKRSNSEAAQPNGPPALMGEHAERREEHIRIFCKQEEDRLRRRHNRISKARNAGWRNCVIYPDCQVSERGEPINRAYSLLSRTQVPLAPAWALTIHKAQGMTLDRVIVDLSRAFEEGQVYVALSRATSLKGLTLRGSREGLKVGLGGNKEVREFLRNYFGI